MTTRESTVGPGFTPEYLDHNPIRQKDNKENIAQMMERTSNINAPNLSGRKWTQAGGISLPSGSNKARNIALALLALLVVCGIATIFIPGALDWITKTAVPCVQHFFQNLTWQQGLEYFALPAAGVTVLGALTAGIIHYRRTHDKSKDPDITMDLIDSESD